MLRRNFLKTVASVSLFPKLPKDFGWKPPFSPSTTPSFIETFPQFKGQGQGRISLLYPYLKIANGLIVPHQQLGNDCTSQATGFGVDIIEAIQSILRKDKWIGKVSTEIIHVGGLKIIGKRSSGGVAIGEAVQFLGKFGNLFRTKYKDYDFRTYNYNLIKRLNKELTKDHWLLEICKKHPIRKATKVTNWDEARDALYKLCPVVIGSAVGFDNAKRDKNGFAEPSGTWYHAWVLIGINDKGPRKGGCLMNSHGKYWVQGPKTFHQPTGSIWVDKKVINRMLGEYGDSFAISNLVGLGKRKYRLCSTCKIPCSRKR